jgi:muramoyltetrapeptide carboxypeptidase
VRFPPALRPGDPVAIVAPSGVFDPALVRTGMEWLSKRYRLLHRKSLFARTADGYLAGSDRRRTAELQWALDAEVAAVVAVRGGYGLSRVVASLDWRFLEKRPKWLVGFSDFTALHAEAWQRGLATAHGPMVAGLARATASTRARWIATLEHPLVACVWPDLLCVRSGQAEGTLVGGNLAMLHAAAAAGRLTLPHGAVLFIEDVGERPYRVDRMLTNLIDSGHLRHVAAIVIGDFTECAPGADGRTVEDVLRERVRRLKVPAVSGFPAGHASRNDALVLGQTVRVIATRSGSSVQGCP